MVARGEHVEEHAARSDSSARSTGRKGTQHAVRQRFALLNEWVSGVRSGENVFLFLVGYRWLSLLLPALALVLRPASNAVPYVVFGLALLNNVLLVRLHPSLNRLVVRKPVFLGIDLAFVAALIGLTGGTDSPYFLYALSPLLATAFFFQIRGGLLAAGVFTLFYAVALCAAHLHTGGAVDVLIALTHVISCFLAAMVFGYPSILLKRIREDAAELQRTQQELMRTETLAAVGRLAAQISHEIRNPLSTVGGFARAMLRKPNDAERVQRNAQIIADEVKRLEELLTETLDLARPPQLELRAENLHDILDKACLLGSGEIQSHAPVAVRKEYDLNLPLVHADARALLRAFLNVIRNGIQAMPEGGTLTIATYGSNRQAQVTIGDTGTGIPPDRLPTIFEPFVSHRARGTGLGLPVTQQIIRGHGGRIEVESQEGKGTRFTFYLPIKPPKRNEVVE
jgi:signal transduction histidine kinase